MTQKENRPHPELEPDLLRTYANQFLLRSDLYSVQNANGSYRSVKRQLNLNHVAAHLRGSITLGAYALNVESQARWLCLDADDDDQWQGVLALARVLEAEKLTPYLETSRRGGHLWLFFAAIPGEDARAFGEWLVGRAGLDDVELYPKQRELTTGPGSLVRLPLGIHRKTGKRYPFITLSGNYLAPTVRTQASALARAERVPPAYIAQALATIPEVALPQPVETIITRPVAADPGEKLSDQLKRQISVLDFVSHYITLNDRGCGRCPFHDDVHQSFSVNVEENYWHCFAGCGGGSLIDFWMKWREHHGEDGSFCATVKALADILLPR